MCRQTAFCVLTGMCVGGVSVCTYATYVSAHTCMRSEVNIWCLMHGPSALDCETYSPMDPGAPSG